MLKSEYIGLPADFSGLVICPFPFEASRSFEPVRAVFSVFWPWWFFPAVSAGRGSRFGHLRAGGLVGSDRESCV